MNLPIGLQLYSARSELSKDFIGSMERIAKIGYQGVEFAGFYDIPADEMKDILAKNNLKAVGSHTSGDLIFNKIDEVIEYNLEIGNKYILFPCERYDTDAEWRKAFEEYEAAGKELKKNGLQLGYHNHAHEFKKLDGDYILDAVYKNTSPEHMVAEPDTYWIYYAGVDPAEYIRKYPGRCPLVHIKDMSDDSEKSTTEVGEGIIDIKSIIKASEESGSEWLIVEQDEFRRPVMESLEIGFNNLKNLINGKE